jgi:hypothetical protein
VQRKEEINVIEKMITKSGRMLKENGGYVNIADLAGETLGGKGFEFISDTDGHVAPEGMVYIALQVLDDAAIASYETDEGAEITGNDFTGEILPTGDITYGRFKKITLSDGKIKAYLGV